MTRYNSLVEANCLVAKARLAVHSAEGPSPAWEKVRRVYAYIEAQAKQAFREAVEDEPEAA
jgi:hypothetical protein